MRWRSVIMVSPRYAHVIVLVEVRATQNLLYKCINGGIKFKFN